MPVHKNAYNSRTRWPSGRLPRIHVARPVGRGPRGEKVVAIAPDDDADIASGFRLGPWTVLPQRGILRSDDLEHHLEPMVMDVLLVLAKRQGQVVTKDQLADEVWNGRFVADDALIVKIAALRQKLGDDSKDPTYIETIPRRGYRLKMPVAALERQDAPYSTVSMSRRRFLPYAVAVAGLVLVGAYTWLPEADRAVESVAILEYRNLSDDPARFQYIVDGFREDLVISLNQIPGLTVRLGPVRRGISQRVDASVSGSVRTDGIRVRITTELVHRDGSQIWTGRFDGAVQEIFALQETVATEVRNALLGETGRQIRATSRPSNQAASMLDLLGRPHLAKRDLASLRRAEELFTEAIERDPQYGPLYLRLAVCYLLQADYDPLRKREYFDRALATARAGVYADPAIEPSMGIVFGFVAHQYGRWKEAERAFQSASRGPAIYPDARHWYSRLLADAGLLHSALAEALAALSLDEESQVLNSRVAASYLWVDDLDSARRFFDSTNEAHIGAPEHYFAYSLFHLRTGNFDQARVAAKTGLELLGANDAWVDVVIDGLEFHDDPQKAEQAVAVLDQVIAAGAPNYIALGTLALFDQPERLMEVALAVARSDIVSDIAVLFLSEASELHRHEAFPKLLDELGLTEYWAGIGCHWEVSRVVCTESVSRNDAN